MNLVAIDKQKRCGTVGYRIAEHYSGQGVAQRGLHQLLQSDELKDLEHLYAQTTTDNVGSQKVLFNNQFFLSAEDSQTFLLNGEERRFVYYQWERKDKNC